MYGRVDSPFFAWMIILLDSQHSAAGEATLLYSSELLGSPGCAGEYRAVSPRAYLHAVLRIFY